jgi:hypothetical protein
MANLPGSTDTRLQRLDDALADLERRVRALEARAVAAPPATGLNEAPPLELGAGRRAPVAGRLDVGGVLSLLGRTFLVFAGAFLLRALTDAGRLPPGAGIVIGLTYAAAWLGAAGLAARRGRRVSAAFHGVAAVLIGYPLLWEASTRFGRLTPPASAGALAMFSLLALGVAWQSRVHTLAGVATLAALGTTAGLIGATGQVAPFAIVAIVVGVVTLWLGYDRDWYWMRWPAALVADVLVLGLASRATSPERLEVPEAAIAVHVLLLVAYLGSFAARTLVRGRLVIPFEVVQTVAVVAVGLGGAVAIARASGGGELALGAAAAALGVGGYAVAFAFVERRHGLGTNFFFYSTLALVFTLVGTVILLTGAPLAFVLAALAALTTWLARRRARLALAAHGAVYALAGAIASGLIAAAASAFVSVAPTRSAVGPAGWVVLAASLLCLAIRRPAQAAVPPALVSVPRLAIAVVLVSGIGSALVDVLARLAAGSPPDPGILATVRTSVLAAAAVVLAVATRYRELIELGWLVYPVLLLGGLKLLVEDFQQSRPATLFIALALYGAALIFAPRLVRRDVRAEAAAAGERPASIAGNRRGGGSAS